MQGVALLRCNLRQRIDGVAQRALMFVAQLDVCLELGGADNGSNWRVAVGDDLRLFSRRANHLGEALFGFGDVPAHTENSNMSMLTIKMDMLVFFRFLHTTDSSGFTRSHMPRS